MTKPGNIPSLAQHQDRDVIEARLKEIDCEIIAYLEHVWRERQELRNALAAIDKRESYRRLRDL